MGGLLTGRFSICKPLFSRHPPACACFFPRTAKDVDWQAFVTAVQTAGGNFRGFAKKPLGKSKKHLY
jgi:hypothetical protein